MYREDEPEIAEDFVCLDWFNSDLNLRYEYVSEPDLDIYQEWLIKDSQIKKDSQYFVICLFTLWVDMGSGDPDPYLLLKWVGFETLL